MRRFRPGFVWIVAFTLKPSLEVVAVDKKGQKDCLRELLQGCFSYQHTKFNACCVTSGSRSGVVSQVKKEEICAECALVYTTGTYGRCYVVVKATPAAWAYNFC